jgi:integrase
LDREGINDPSSFHQNTAPAVTFREQAEFWLKQLKEEPVKPSYSYSQSCILNKWLLPLLGGKQLRDVNNGELKLVVETMRKEKLSASTIRSYTNPIKYVLDSAVDKDGNKLYPRTWNDSFVRMPIIDKRAQHRPTITPEQIENKLPLLKHRERMLCGLLIITGPRVGESLAFETDDFSSDCRIVRVKKNNWRGQILSPKTPNAVREVDIPPDFAAVLCDYISEKSGYLFATKSGRPLSQRNALRSLHAVGLRGGFHMFRRFREELLVKKDCPRELRNFWMGRACETVGQFYALGICNDLNWRRRWAEDIGLGFNWATVGHKVAQIHESNAA